MINNIKVYFPFHLINFIKSQSEIINILGRTELQNKKMGPK